jgi:hypothetical protein
VYLEVPIGYESPPRLMSLSVCPSIWNTKTCRFLM